jgi:O-antigen ligase/polysaccharide polymerase Wzy-like membrane protein
MLKSDTISEPESPDPVSLPGWAHWTDSAIFMCLAVIAICAPIATKGATNAFRAAIVLWLIKMCAGRARFYRQPLSLPLLLFLSFSFISTLFSVDPFLSWGRMRTVTLLFIAVLLPQTLISLRQIKILTALLISACCLTVMYTAWQYTAGIGVKLVATGVPGSRLSKFGLQPDDIIQRVNGKRTLTPQQLFTRLRQEPTDAEVHLLAARSAPAEHLKISIQHRQELENYLQQPGFTLGRGHPARAEGFLKHYFPYSEVLVLIGVLVWGLCIAGGNVSVWLRVILCFAFLAITAAVGLTLTRISLVSLLLGSLLISLMRAERKTMVRVLLGFIVVIALGVHWIDQRRALTIFDTADPGTQYRLLMWRDSIKLIRAHPVVGVGLDSVSGDWPRWDLEAYRRFPLHTHFHSTPIQLAVECGLPTLTVWMALMTAYLVFLVRLLRLTRHQGWFAQGLTLGVLGGLVAFLLISLVQYSFGDAEAMVVFWFCMGLVLAVQRVLAPALSPGVAYQTPPGAQKAASA